MYRPDGKCKLCDREFEIDFNQKSAGSHYYGRPNTGRVNPCKFVPCMHKIFCVDCAKTEKYIGEKIKFYYADRFDDGNERENCIGKVMACPFCESSINKIVYYTSFCNRWFFQILNSKTQ